MHRLEQGLGREEDIELVLDACDNVSPGLGWPPKQTTICVLGPSIPSAIVSVAKLFRDELLVHVKDGVCPFPPDKVRRG
jgi:NADH-quinone oxidoreductase subunit F